MFPGGKGINVSMVLKNLGLDSIALADETISDTTREYLEKILDLGRSGKKPRKDLVYARQIMNFISYFFDDMFRIEDELPEEVPAEDVKEILRRSYQGN